MTERTFRLSHRILRLVASFTLAYLSAVPVLDKYFARYSHVLANNNVGTVLNSFVISTSLLLPLYVGLEVWWMRRGKRERVDLWIDAVLAVCCLLVLCLLVLYYGARYVMF